MIDLRLVRDDLDSVKAALGRRGVDPAEVDRLAELDAAHRQALGIQESLRSRVKAISRQVGEAKRAGDEKRSAELSGESRRLGEEERSAAAGVESLAAAVRAALLDLPNLPADEAPDGAGPEDNVERRRWWPGMDVGEPEPEWAEHQRVPHWEIGEALGILDMERGAKLSGSMFPLYRGDGARLLRALTSFALARHADAYEEIRPPTLVLTETMTSTGHLPKFADEAYHVERDDLWAIPTAEVPLTSMRRGEILDEGELPAPLQRGDGVLPARGRRGGAGHPGPAAGPRVRQGGAVRLRHPRTGRRGPGRHPGPGRGIAPRTRAFRTGSSTCAPGTWAGPRPARSTSRCTRRAATAGSRSPRSAGSATTRRAGPTSGTGPRPVGHRCWSTR